MTATDDRLRILYLEPYESGSHAAFTRALTLGVDADWTVVTLPGRHWKWRMRGSAAWATLARPDALGAGYDLVFASAYLPPGVPATAEAAQRLLRGKLRGDGPDAMNVRELLELLRGDRRRTNLMSPARRRRVWRNRLAASPPSPGEAARGRSDGGAR